jgi:hypothetical protein
LAGVFGGSDGSYLSTNQVYNHASNTWASRTAMPSARAFLAAAPLGPGLAGAFGGTGDWDINDNEIYDYNANVWIVRASMPTRRSGLAAAELDSGVVGTFGGVVGTASSKVTEIYSY